MGGLGRDCGRIVEGAMTFLLFLCIVTLGALGVESPTDGPSVMVDVVVNHMASTFYSNRSQCHGDAWLDFRHA